MELYDLECPYCDAKLEVCHDDGFGYEEGKRHEMQCGKCDKNFVFETSISFYYEPSKADCLNDEPHDLEAGSTSAYNMKHWPDHVRCKKCDYEVRGKYVEEKPHD